MAFYESPRFPERIAAGAVGGPRFNTSVVVNLSGAEQRIANWQYPLHQWDVSQGINGPADFEALRAFFLTMQGRLHGWRFRHLADFRASHSGAERGVVQGLTSTTFALLKRYSSGAQSQDRRIHKPVAAGFELRDLGSPLASPGDYSLNTVTGIVTTTIARTAANLTWAGEFDVPMRFDTDQMQARAVARNAARGLLHEWAAIPIVELRVP